MIGGASPNPRPVRSLETVLLGLFLACWVVVLVSWLRLVSLAGNAPVPLYRFFSFASALGWVAGTLYIQRGRQLPDAGRRLLRWVYYLGPQGIVYLLRAMAPLGDQQAAPLVPVYALGVFSVFFLVPVTVKGVMR
ncbi:MAG TPA: hypothetical protein VOA87_22490 [Thermoanaerobaculia bacterium]|nr:hypothetical protein [Thermoanaerobaculia bacterium]